MLNECLSSWSWILLDGVDFVESSSQRLLITPVGGAYLNVGIFSRISNATIIDHDMVRGTADIMCLGCGYYLGFLPPAEMQSCPDKFYFLTMDSLLDSNVLDGISCPESYICRSCHNLIAVCNDLSAVSLLEEYATGPVVMMLNVVRGPRSQLSQADLKDELPFAISCCSCKEPLGWEYPKGEKNCPFSMRIMLEKIWIEPPRVRYILPPSTDVRRVFMFKE